jgi:ATP-dependent protease ClpP protease subunit
MQPKIIRIDGAIGTGPSEVSAQMVRDQLPENGTDPIVVKIHSEGGNVFEGFAIHDAFAAYTGPKSLSIESSAFSIASFIAMAFDDVSISPNGYMMLHNPYAGVEGDDEDLAKSSVLLAQLKTSMVNAYAIRSGRTEDEIRSILKDETYLNAEQAVAMGFATRVTGQSVIGRPFAKLSNLPHGVVAALFGAGSGGENREPTQEISMSDSQPVAATIEEIEAAFPKAKAEFVVACIKQKLPMASVATVAVKEMMAENEALVAKIAAMEEDMAKAKAAMEPSKEEEEVEAKAKAEYDEEDKEEEAKAKARSGVRPVAKSKTSGPSARIRWDSAVESCLPKCNGNKVKAVAMANRNNPGLRQAYLDEVNS